MTACAGRSELWLASEWEVDGGFGTGGTGIGAGGVPTGGSSVGGFGGGAGAPATGGLGAGGSLATGGFGVGGSLDAGAGAIGPDTGPPCEPGTERCLGLVPQRCGDDGTYESLAACEFDCLDGVCLCPLGFTSTDGICTPDTCEGKPWGCAPNAICIDDAGGTTCECLPNYVGDGFECSLPSTVYLDEGFDDVESLFEPSSDEAPEGSNWLRHNASEPLGITSWFQGNVTAFEAHDGAENAYVGANFNSAADVGTISTWLATPVVPFEVGARLSFFVRGSPGPWPDRLEVRVCSGIQCDLPVFAQSVENYESVLLTVNPDLIDGAFPTEWTSYVLEDADGLPLEGEGRIAFRYFVTDGGPDGANSNYIGIDRVVLQTGYTPAYSVSVTVLGVQGAGLVLVLNGSSTLAVDAPGTFTFSQQMSEGTPYAVALDALPPGQSCTITNGEGVVGTTDVTGIAVNCSTP
jgi:hypothetical protein